MGYWLVFSPCVRCHTPFFYNPLRVPSVTVEGERQPVCRACVEAVNPGRIARGLDPIVPLPGAYEALDEGDMTTVDEEELMAVKTVGPWWICPKCKTWVSLDLKACSCCHKLPEEP